MTAMTPDPEQAGQWLIGNAAVGPFGRQTGPTFLTNVHDPSLCADRPCVVHHPSAHHMAGWPLNWRDDTGVMERLCPHGVGHPDPDDVAYQAQVGRGWVAVHGCDGCCEEPS